MKFMLADNVFSVQTDMDQEEVAKLVARYDILAVPVVDGSNRLMGIVTVDDVIDILRKEATEDILKMAGAGEEFVETKSIIKSTRIRLPWLFASCLGGIFAFFIIGEFENSLSKIAYLAAFIPVIMGMGGNIVKTCGTQLMQGIGKHRGMMNRQVEEGSHAGMHRSTQVGRTAGWPHNQTIGSKSHGAANHCADIVRTCQPIHGHQKSRVGTLLTKLLQRRWGGNGSHCLDGLKASKACQRLNGFLAGHEGVDLLMARLQWDLEPFHPCGVQ